jgi:hypothetical protein
MAAPLVSGRNVTGSKRLAWCRGHLPLTLDPVPGRGHTRVITQHGAAYSRDWLVVNGLTVLHDRPGLM